jgi:cell wall-associated NlpC family hydrolase
LSAEQGLDRRGFIARGLAAASTALLCGCDGLSNQAWVKRILDSAETLTRVTQQALLSPQALAREFSEADISREFKANGSTNPDDAVYVAQARDGFAGWRSGGRTARGFACRASRHAIAHPDHAA